MPNVNEKIYKDNLIKIISAITGFVESQMKECAINRVYCNIQIILIDNNAEPKVIYDSKSYEQFKKSFANYNLQNSCKSNF